MSGKAASSFRPARIFWLGMHKILVETEFRLLQDMGYEVFRPPYLSPVADQSTSESTDLGNACLPSDVFEKLSTYNFFYNSFSPEMGELLEAHFDAIVVTINPDWLKAALQAFHGTVIYRCYGQLGSVSATLLYNGCRSLIARRDNFSFLPHAPECLDVEESWLLSLAAVVPYWLPGDVLALRETWQGQAPSRQPTVALTCPNITNAYYNDHFRYLKRHFEERCFRYYGVQLEPNADFNVVGTLPRDDQLARLAREAGFLYTYRESNLCYLPPIEMMVMGGPVLYLPGSLLARYFGGRAPGLVRDEAEAVTRSKQLIQGDQALISEIVSSQARVAHRYTPEFGEAAFRREFSKIVPLRLAPVVSAGSEALTPASRRVLLFAHIGGYVERNGQFASIHGIPRVMRQLVRALNDMRITVSVTYAKVDRSEILGFYSEQCAHPELVEVVEAADVVALSESDLQSRYAYAIVPHYHLFPEANAIPLPLLAYVPDFLPHFFEGRGWFPLDSEDIDCGRRLVARARRVLTSSRFSASYLPDSRLHVPKERITVFPLPYLGSVGARRAAERPAGVPGVLQDDLYIFYPTQPHPHKRLDLLVLAWLLVNRSRTAPLRLVLTAGFLPARLMELIAASSMSPFLDLLPAIDDDAIEWLYRNARCLAFSSELEGNFPTQILEALHLDCPIACTDNPLIVNELDELVNYLQVAPFGDVEAFANCIAYCVEHRDDVLRQQMLVKEHVLPKFAYETFQQNVAALHESMAIQPSDERNSAVCD